MDRITEQIKGLAIDIRDWMALRVAHDVEIELSKKMCGKTLALYAVMVFLTLTTVLFWLLAAVWALGDILGHLSWGFLVLSAVTALIVGMLYLAKGSRHEKPTSETVVTSHHPTNSQ